MKKVICLLFAGTFACQPERPAGEVYSNDPSGESRWEMYEGRVTLDEKTNLYIELSLLPSQQAQGGSFELQEYVETGHTLTSLPSFKGRYSSFQKRNNTPATYIQLHHTAREKGLVRTYETRRSRGNTTTRTIREESFRKADLSLKWQTEEVLLVLDDHQRGLTGEEPAELRHRTSKLFTVEGYFRHKGDTADFLEMNTGEVWALTKLGDYELASRQYYLLATRKGEPIYLKGVAYTVRHTAGDGRRTEALVLKKIVQMSSVPERGAE